MRISSVTHWLASMRVPGRKPGWLAVVRRAARREAGERQPVRVSTESVATLCISQRIALVDAEVFVDFLEGSGSLERSTTPGPR